ncbi:Titin [Lasius niger]|uniref:Titin n=1 Tax=Lasius niger TaxID=67767 RepID=A0A0J7JZA7_LASNI|nr:Titin [Lasius niger]
MEILQKDEEIVNNVEERKSIKKKPAEKVEDKKGEEKKKIIKKQEPESKEVSQETTSKLEKTVAGRKESISRVSINHKFFERF